MKLNNSPKAIFNVLASKLVRRSENTLRSKVGKLESHLAVAKIPASVTAAIAGGDYEDQIDLTILPGSIVDNNPETLDHINFELGGQEFDLWGRGYKMDLKKTGEYERLASLEMPEHGSEAKSSKTTEPNDRVRRSPRAISSILRGALSKNNANIQRLSIGDDTSFTVLKDTTVKVSGAIIGESPQSKVPVTISAGSHIDDCPETEDDIEFRLAGQDYLSREGPADGHGDEVFLWKANNVAWDTNLHELPKAK